MVATAAADEIPAGTWPTVSSFYTTVEVSVPTLQGFLQSLVVNPTPAPPGPSIRTQEEEPVVDAATGTTTAGGGGGGGGEGGGDGEEGGGGGDGGGEYGVAEGRGVPGKLEADVVLLVPLMLLV